jgi:proline iminopeptidase
MTIDNYVEQVQKLVLHLGIKEFNLYGQSWGTILGVEYYSKYPEKVKSMILSSPAIDIERCRYDTDSLVKTLSESSQQTIKNTTETGNFGSMEYQLAMLEFYQKYVVTKLPWSTDMDSTAANTGTAVYLYMWGPSEFTATGTLKTYNGTTKLSKIKVPVQFIVGDHDEISIPTTMYYQSLVPGSKLSITTNAGHLTMQDNAAEDMTAIRKFLEENK